MHAQDLLSMELRYFRRIQIITIPPFIPTSNPTLRAVKFPPNSRTIVIKVLDHSPNQKTAKEPPILASYELSISRHDIMDSCNPYPKLSRH